MPVNFIADEDVEEGGIDFTPDPSPAVAEAPRPIIQPPSMDEERAGRRAVLDAEMQKEQQRGQLAEATLDRLGLLERGIRPFASTPENPLGGIGSAVKPVGVALNAAGEVTANAAKDFLQGAPPLSRYLYGTPAERKGNVVQEGIVEAARMLPAVAGSVGLMSVGVPPQVAFAGPMAAQTFDSTDGDIAASLRSGAVGAVLPGVGEMGRRAAAKVLGGAVERGVLSSSATTTQKALEAVGAQGTIQVLMEGMNLPAYVAATPEERKKMLIKSIISNAAFAGMDVPGILSKRASATQTELGGHRMATAQAGEVLDQLVNDPAAVEQLRVAADDFALKATDPRNAQRQVALPETMRELAKEQAPAPAPIAESVAEASKSVDPVEVTIKARTPAGEEISLKMEAGEAQRRFTQRKTVLEALRDCMGGK